MTADEVIALLGLQPLEPEGGHWAQTWIDERSTAIYFLIQPDRVSNLHRLDTVEVYHHYAGAPAELWLLRPDGTADVVVLGADLAAGQRPLAVVPPGTWQGSRPLGPWSLLGCTMAPPFRPDGFELGNREALLAAYPALRAGILALTRAHGGPDAGPVAAGAPGPGGGGTGAAPGPADARSGAAPGPTSGGGGV